MGCCNCIIVETPISIRDSQTKEYTPGTPVPRDVFREVCDGLDVTIKSAVMGAMWNRYGHRMISACDVDFWVEVVKSFVDLNAARMLRIMNIENALKSRYTDDSTEGMHSVTGSEDLPDTASGATEFLNNRVTQDISRSAGLTIKTAADMMHSVPDAADECALLISAYFIEACL